MKSSAKLMVALLAGTFVLSFTMGAAASGKGGNDSFGVIALVAMMPLLAVQLMGIIFKMKQRKSLGYPVKPDNDNNSLVNDNNSPTNDNPVETEEVSDGV